VGCRRSFTRFAGWIFGSKDRNAARFFLEALALVRHCIHTA
jgi:hypothetical protein